MAISIHIDHIEQVTITGVPGPTVRWQVGPVVAKTGGRSMSIEVHLSNEEKVRLAVTPMTPGGQPAPVDGAAVWEVDGACTVEPIDATSAWVLSGTEVGDSTVTVACDADMGAGVVTIMDTCVVHVASPMAANLGLAADAPVLKSEP